MKKSKRASMLVICLLALLLFPGLIKAEKIELRLLAGMNYLSGGDINKGDNPWIGLFAMAGYSMETKPVHLGFDFGGDIIINLTPKIGIGFGVGYIQGAKTSELTVSNGEEGTFTNKPKISAVPIKLGLFFNIPLSEVMNVVFNVGGGLYLAKYSCNFRVEENGGWAELNQETNASGLGFHGGIGLEFNLAPNIAFVIEGQGRYAKFGGFEGTCESSGDIEDSGKFEGTLYYYEWREDGKIYPTVFVSSQRPPGSVFSNVREAKVDFSGFTLMAGIKIKF